jgi:hypothetical protein
MNKENMTAKEFLQILSGLCKKNSKVDMWNDTTFNPSDEFGILADMIDNFLQYDHNESEVKND